MSKWNADIFRIWGLFFWNEQFSEMDLNLWNILESRNLLFLPKKCFGWKVLASSAPESLRHFWNFYLWSLLYWNLSNDQPGTYMPKVDAQNAWVFLRIWALIHSRYKEMQDRFFLKKRMKLRSTQTGLGGVNYSRDWRI